jgi:hypothetical protein
MSAEQISPNRCDSSRPPWRPHIIGGSENAREIPLQRVTPRPGSAPATIEERHTRGARSQSGCIEDTTRDRHRIAAPDRCGARALHRGDREGRLMTESHSPLTVHSSNRKPATVASIAAIEFGGVKEFVQMTKDERLRKIHGLLDNVRPIAMLAGELMASDKDELIAKLAPNIDMWGVFLMGLADAGDDLKMLHNIVSSAEMRLAVAFANVEGDPPDDGGDDAEAAA